MNRLTVEDIQSVLAVIFPGIVVTLVNEGTDEDPALSYDLGHTGACIRQVPVKVTRHSILGSREETVIGWQAFVGLTTGGGRDTPPDWDEVPLTEGFETLDMAITAAAGALVMSAVGDTLADIVVGRIFEEEGDYV